MATNFKNAIVPAIGTSPVTVATSGASSRLTIIGLSLTNVTGASVLASIQINDTVNSVSAYYIQNVIVPQNQSLRVVSNGEKLILGPSTQVIISANTASSLDLIMSYVEII